MSDVGDEKVDAVDARAFEDMIEKTIGGADEGMMALILFAARRFADQMPQSGPGASGARSLLL